MNTHPLVFFKDLIEESNTIEKLRQKFFSAYHSDMILELDRDREFIKVMNPLDSESDSIFRYFHGYLKEACNEGMHGCLKQVEVDVLSAGDSAKEKNYLKKIVDEIDSLISKKNDRNDLDKYTFIVTTLESTKEYIQSHYGLVKKDSHVSPLQTSPKIQWLGKTNVLTTLFYDLLNGQDKGEPYIHATKKDVMQFLIENFLDKNGDELSESTVQSYFDKQEKKAKIGDRIELPNKKVAR